MGNHIEVVRVLLNVGRANHQICNLDKKTPIELAEHNKKILDVFYIYQAEQAEALRLAVQDGKLEQIRCLISQGADIHTTDSDGNNLLRIAIKAKQPQVARYLSTVLKEADVEGTCLMQRS